MFFITGLPRSRTAWLANLLTFKDSFCFHELSRIGSDPSKILSKLRTRSETHVGSSDQLLPYYIDYVTERIGNFRLIIIDRPKIESKVSMAKWYGRADYQIEGRIDALDTKLQEIKMRYNYKLINYEDLNDPNVIEQLWYYCIPSVKFDVDRFNMLNEFNVQVMKEKYLHKLNGKEIQSLMEA